MENETEVWRRHPEIDKIEVSSFGRIRSLKGHCYKINPGNSGYPQVQFYINGKHINKAVHRLVAETFVSNPDNMSRVHHKNGNKTNNNANNLEWRADGWSNKDWETVSKPVFAIKLATLEVSQFHSQAKAAKALGAYQQNINSVVKGRLKKTNGYLFVTADDTAVDVAKQKLYNLGKTELTTAADAESVKFVSQFNAKSLL